MKNFATLLILGGLALACSLADAADQTKPGQAPPMKLNVTPLGQFTNPNMEGMWREYNVLSEAVSKVTCVHEIDRAKVNGIPADAIDQNVISNLLSAYEPRKGMQYGSGLAKQVTFDNEPSKIDRLKKSYSAMIDKEGDLQEAIASVSDKTLTALADPTLSLFSAQTIYVEVLPNGQPGAYVTPQLRIIYDNANKEVLMMGAGGCD